MKKPVNKNNLSSAVESFDEVLAAALKTPVFFFEDKAVRDWIDEFVVRARPCLEQLYKQYRIRPELIFVWAALCTQAPVPQTFPKQLRNGRQRERTAKLLERTADSIYQLGALDLYGVKLFSDGALDLKLKAAAMRIRRLNSISGRPETPIMRDYAIMLRELFWLSANSPLYDFIDELLHAAYPTSLWASHANAEDAIRKLIGGRRLDYQISSKKDEFKNLHDIEVRKVVMKYEEALTKSNMSAPIYQTQLRRQLRLARQHKIRSV